MPLEPVPLKFEFAPPGWAATMRPGSAAAGGRRASCAKDRRREQEGRLVVSL